tara:strand:+ start:338 stop:610 length:273 start_codon:yes stop_codon:yes gene_type:complete
MRERKSETRIDFAHSFVIKSHNETFPAGSYVLESYDELIDGISFIAYRTLQTFMRISTAKNGVVTQRILEVDRAEIDAALLADTKAKNTK